MWGLMIICYICMFVSFIFLSITGLQSYFGFMIFKASYQEFALFSTTFYMFSETLIMFYFIGSGTAIKKEVIHSGIVTSAYDRIKQSKMILFPHLTFNMLIMGTAFILIGAVDTGSISHMTQMVCFMIAYVHFLYTIKIQHNGFKENINVIIEIANLDRTESVAH